MSTMVEETQEVRREARHLWQRILLALFVRRCDRIGRLHVWHPHGDRLECELCPAEW